MQSEIIYMFAMSLDGYIAREDGSVDWLDAFPADSDYDFDTFLASLTGIIMGRGAYDIARRGDQWHYARWPCIVATRRPVEGLPPNAEALAGSPADLVANLRSRGAAGRIWLFGGGDLVRQFLDAGMLDTVEIGIIPVVIGAGIPAFGGAQPDRWFNLDFAKPLANGAVHVRYTARTTNS